MTRRPLHPCNRPGCRTLTPRRFCDAHTRAAQAAYDAGRPTATGRGYDADWRRLRVTILVRDPFCRAPDCHALSTDVDHIVPLTAGGTNEASNLQGLCHACHAAKTLREDGGFKRPKLARHPSHA